MEDKTLNISVSIADRPYRLKVKPEEEADVREAAKKINDRIMEFQKSYHANDKQDYLAMAALLFTTENITNSRTMEARSGSLDENLEEIDDALTAFLSSV